MSADNILNFTKRTLEAISAPPKGKRLYFRDSKQRGLILDVTPSGTKSFYFYRKIHGRPVRLLLGRFPDLSVEQARGIASEKNAQVAKGEDPSDSQSAEHWGKKTLDVAFHLYMEKHAKLHNKTWHESERKFALYLNHWKHRRLETFQRHEIEAWHGDIKTKVGPVTANRVLALLHVVFNKAIAWGWDAQNPARSIKKFRERSRDRFLQRDELPIFFKALSEEENDTVRDYILMSLLTGARRSNVMGMCWADVHLERGEWKIPETKNGEPHTIPLSDPALQILKMRHENRGDSLFVFPGTGKTGHLVEPKKVWQRILKHAGIQDLRLHDLRRTLGSWMAMSGATTAMIGKTLAHKSLNTTQIYERMDLDPIRASMSLANAQILQAAGISPLSKTKNQA